MTEIVQTRHFIDLNTRLGEIPEPWLRLIEPHIMRGGYLPCWVWVGRLHAKGYPIVWDPKSKREILVRREIAAMFWRAPQNAKVMNTCNTRNCVNPGHFQLTCEGVNAYTKANLSKS